MKVSIVLPTYNRVDLIGESLNSILAQTFTGYEIIVVDDGSSDNTAEKVNSMYGGKVRYLRQEHSGPGAARNKGMEAAEGEYITFLDSDDLYYPYKLDLQVNLLDLYPDVGMVYTEFSAFDDDKLWDEYHLRNYHGSAYQRGGITYESLFTRKFTLKDSEIHLPAFCASSDIATRNIYIGKIFDAYLLNIIAAPHTMMFRREILNKVGMQHTRFGLFHDLEFALRICKYFDVAFIDVPTYKHRYHAEQVSRGTGAAGAHILIKKQSDLLKVTKEHSFADPNYYRKHKYEIDQQLAKLYRAVAVPMLAYDGGTPHTRKYYPKRARKYLQKCMEYGKPERILYFLTYFPPLPRRIAFKLYNIVKKFLGNLIR